MSAGIPLELESQFRSKLIHFYPRDSSPSIATFYSGVTMVTLLCFYRNVWCIITVHLDVLSAWTQPGTLLHFFYSPTSYRTAQIMTDMTGRGTTVDIHVMAALFFHFWSRKVWGAAIHGSTETEFVSNIFWGKLRNATSAKQILLH